MFPKPKPEPRREQEAAVQYHSNDFEWEELKHETENDSSLAHHLSLPSQSMLLPISSDSQAWNCFHLRHSTGKFFKERRYLLKEFPELVSSDGPLKLLEVGCGNGSTVLPILCSREDIIVYACDCSNEALDRAKEIIVASKVVSVEQRFHTFCCDFTTSEFPKWLACISCREITLQKKHSSFSENTGIHLNFLSSLEDGKCCIGGVDFVSLIFTLSAVPHDKMPRVVKECFSVLKPGGILLFRDYGLYDMTMLRFEPHKRVCFREYMRSDGTRSYFFSLDTVRDLFVGAGFIQLELEYCCVKSLNRRNGKSMRRVWVHGKFRRLM